MTPDYTKVASRDVINAMWLELQNAGLFKASDYFADGFTDALIPIFPAQQIPEMNNLLPGKPYFTYDIQQKQTGVSWWMSEEVIMLEIISRNGAQIQAITNFLVDLFRRYDQSAGDINVQLTPNSPFKFMYFRLDSADPVQSFTDEGGFMSGDISISYAYVRDLDPITGRYA
jgi:hypothetical protein